MKAHWFQRYILPGLIFQSAIIAGAYGSGQELVEFFLPYGPLGGLMGMAAATVVFSLVISVTFEFSRQFQLFDYRSLFKKLLGRGWIVYEALYLLLMLLIISVVGAAAGNIVQDVFELPPILGTLGVMTLIALLVFYGTSAIEGFFTLWSFILYGVYIVFFAFTLSQYGDTIFANLSDIEVKSGWLGSGVAYAGYNLAMIPILLFCIRHVQKRKEAVIAGLLAGPMAMIPAMLFFTAMIGQYGALVAEGNTALPVTLLLDALDGARFLTFVFPIILFGTFVETGAAMIHGVNERIDNVYAERKQTMPRAYRPAIAIVILTVATTLASLVGLTDLIAQGYGYITYGFILVFVLPIMTYGIWLIYKADERAPDV